MGFQGLAFGLLGFEVWGFRGIGFRVWGFTGLGFGVSATPEAFNSLSHLGDSVPGLGGWLQDFRVGIENSGTGTARPSSREVLFNCGTYASSTGLPVTNFILSSAIIGCLLFRCKRYLGCESSDSRWCGCLCSGGNLLHLPVPLRVHVPK